MRIRYRFGRGGFVGEAVDRLEATIRDRFWDGINLPRLHPLAPFDLRGALGRRSR